MEGQHPDNARTRFIEEFGALFSVAGVPPMAGRVLAMLLLSEEGLPSGDLVAALGVSKGAVSTATRLLVQFHMVDRYHVRGSRQTHFRTRPGLWTEALRQKMAVLSGMRALAEQGLELVGDAARARERIEEMRGIYSFFEESLPEMFERWERERGAR